MRVKLKKRPNILVRHGRLLSVLGAVIVFATFIVKDAIRENIKEQIDSIQTGINSFDILSSQGGNEEDASVYYETIMGILVAKPLPAAYEFGRNRDFEKQYAVVSSMNQRAMITQRSSLALFHRLSRVHPDIDAQFKACNRKLMNSLYTFDTFDAIDKDPTKMTQQEADKAVDKAKKALFHSGRLAELTVGDSAALANEIMHFAREEQEALEGKYRIVTRLSYALYTIGWTLALAGRFLGLEGLAIAD
jgi:hypothetical protein